MTDEEILNDILIEINSKDGVSGSDLHVITRRISGEDNAIQFYKKIIRDRHIEFTNSGYKLTLEGKSFLLSGGYVTYKRREDESYNDGKEILFWSRVAGIAALTAILLMIIFFVFENTQK